MTIWYRAGESGHVGKRKKLTSRDVSGKPVCFWTARGFKGMLFGGFYVLGLQKAAPGQLLGYEDIDR